MRKMVAMMKKRKTTSSLYLIQQRLEDLHPCTGRATTAISKSFGYSWKREWTLLTKMFTETIAFTKLRLILNSKSSSALCLSEWTLPLRMQGLILAWTWQLTQKRALWSSRLPAKLIAWVVNAVVLSSISVTSSSIVQWLEPSTVEYARKGNGFLRTNRLMLRSAQLPAALRPWLKSSRLKKDW